MDSQLWGLKDPVFMKFVHVALSSELHGGDNKIKFPLLLQSCFVLKTLKTLIKLMQNLL